jgi:hypothetical protein
MDGEDRLEEADSTLSPIVGYHAEAAENPARTLGSLDASQLRRPSSLEVRDGLVRQIVQPSGQHVLFELSIPLGGIELGKPISKGAQVTGRQLANRCFDFLNRAHHGLH